MYVATIGMIRLRSLLCRII